LRRTLQLQAFYSTSLSIGEEGYAVQECDATMLNRNPMSGPKKKYMPRVAFLMKLFPGREAEYKKRHDEIWPALSALLKQQGISDYSIFLEESTGQLFGYLVIDDPAMLDRLRDEPMMWEWWSYMKDIMESNEDGSPKSISLKEVFYLA